MSVLVIGATGFIGPRLIRKLVARGETVVGMDLNPGAAAFADVPIGAPVLRGDITQFEDVMRTDARGEAGARHQPRLRARGRARATPIRSCASTSSAWTTASRPRAWPASSGWSTRARSR